MDNTIQIKRFHYTKFCERTLFHDLINNCLGKSENLKPQGSLHVLLLFSFQKQPPKIILKNIYSNILQNSIED